MKTFITFIILYLLCFPAIAQVGIGTISPNSSSILDITANDKGLLIPRMTQSQRDLISSPVNGLLIFQTNNTPGFYYYYGSSWNNISNDTDAWSLTGNSGTNPSSNFIGTTDAQDLAFRVNNVEKIRLSQLGQLEYYNASNSIFIGQEAGENDNQTNNTNIGIGYQSLYDNTNGYDNIAIGRLSLTNNTTGRDNTAIGEEALINNLTGYDNIAVGDKLLSALTSGNNNIAIGDRTLITTNGNYNIAIGSSAGSTNTGSSNIFLGYRAGSSETGSNKLYIENTGENADNALIYGEFDNNILRTNGELQIGNPATTGYALPTTDGLTDEVLTTDGSGAVTWSTITEVDGDVTNELQDLTLAGDELQISGGTSASMRAFINPKYPDGFVNVDPITFNDLTGGFTVPAGKNLYITNIFSDSNFADLTVNSTITIMDGQQNTADYQAINNPIILGAGSVLEGDLSLIKVNGFLVDAYCQPFISSTNYTVPAGKILVILNYLSFAASDLIVDSVTLYNGLGINSTPGIISFINPIFVDEGEVVSSSATAGTFMINGYLIDK